nr:hypothetical protein [Tanacetum cinerariifolium]
VAHPFQHRPGARGGDGRPGVLRAAAVTAQSGPGNTEPACISGTTALRRTGPRSIATGARADHHPLLHVAD